MQVEDIDDGWLELEYSKNLEKDVFLLLMKINYPLWKLYKFTKSRRLALFIGRIQYTQAEKIRNDIVANDAPYDSILEDCFRDLINTIKENNLCAVLENIKIKNIRGFDFFNAMAFPCFGENLLAINTGVFFLSHPLARSIEILYFNKFYGPEIVELILSNEEIAADAFSIMILQQYQRTLNDYSLALYSPQFLFKIFSNFDEIRVTIKSKSHPSNLERYNYIKKMIGINEYDSFDNVINIIWDKCRQKIRKKCYKQERFVENNISIWKEIRCIILEEVNKE